MMPAYSREMAERLRDRKAEIETLRRQLADARKALQKYGSCRHGQQDCFCVAEAREAIHATQLGPGKDVTP